MSAEGVKRPIQIEEFKVAIRESSDGELQRVKNEIQNNIRHLEKSNKSLRAYINKIEGKASKDEVLDGIEELDNIDSNDLDLFKDSLQENEIILKNNRERIDALEQEHIYRTSGSHTTATATQSTTTQKHASTNVETTSVYL